jgi:hypothetical protein
VSSRLTWRASVGRTQKEPVIRKPIVRTRRPDGVSRVPCASEDI